MNKEPVIEHFSAASEGWVFKVGICGLLDKLGCRTVGRVFNICDVDLTLESCIDARSLYDCSSCLEQLAHEFDPIIGNVNLHWLFIHDFNVTKSWIVKLSTRCFLEGLSATCSRRRFLLLNSTGG